MSVSIVSPTAALKDLLQSLFSEYELRAFVAHRLPDDPRLAALLPGETAPLARLADEAAQLIARRGLATRAMFEAMRAEVPGRAADIERVAALWSAGSVKEPERVAVPVEHRTADGWDVFIAYAQADRPWVTLLAENLHRLAVRVFFDEWEIGPGDVVTRRLEHGLRDSRSGILVVSPTAVASPMVMEAYAALLVRSVGSGLRLVPVLYADAEVPPMLATRRWVDLRGKTGEAYLEAVRGLARTLRGEPPGPPTLTGPLGTP